MSDDTPLSRREREIMDVVYQLGTASTNDVLAKMADPPSRTAVRTVLRILEQKGHLAHRLQGREYVYRPVKPRQAAGRSAVQRVLRTFFGGSLEKAVAVYLSDPGSAISAEELERVESLIREARKKGR